MISSIKIPAVVSGLDMDQLVPGSEELLPCPFCGSEAVFVEYRNANRVRCTGCRITSPLVGDRPVGGNIESWDPIVGGAKVRAAARWNQRTRAV